MDTTRSFMNELMVLSLEECLEVLNCSVELKPLLVHRLRNTMDARVFKPSTYGTHCLWSRSEHLVDLFAGQMLTVARRVMARAWRVSTTSTSQEHDIGNSQLHKQIMGGVEVALCQTDANGKFDTDWHGASLGVCRDLQVATLVQDMRCRNGCGEPKKSCQSSDTIDTHPDTQLW
jgi:hypothetical protein